MYSLKYHKINNVSHQDLICLFDNYQHQDYACLLDSCENTSINSQFDIVVKQPVITFELKTKQISLKGAWKHKFSRCKQDCPFDSLSILHKEFCELFETKTDPALTSLPFVVGTLGCFAYDLNVVSDNIKDRNPTQFLMPDIALGFYDHSVIFDNLNSELYFIDWDEQRLQQSVTDFQRTITNKGQTPLNKGFELQSDWKANIDRETYIQQLSTVNEYLLAGDCYQVNFAQRFSAKYKGSEWTAYKRLKKANKAPYSAFIRLPNSCILSVSPERFLCIKDGQVETKPIKGTRKRSPNQKTDASLAQALLASEKDKAENLMIVDLLRNDLSKHCLAGSVKVPQLFKLESYPAVHHMVSTVVGELKQQSSPFDILKGAFPGGSITGAPKIRAMQIIQELEPDKRSIYCGSIGYVGIKNDMDTNICIRTLLAEDGMMHCWAGGGIVIDSEAEDEYLETLHKVDKILPVMAAKTSSDFD
ncbi:aminodeoxychorismate synthase component I [Glaciecola petra]|uniref:aminodeoxychorismate synthase n=1 Tax=Glaciecola petra TaxID=3075602 RepID=A0ABU2ZP73_9ALTE|nr:aminodeoxychorismate synthase component I [Aestuariibacter sp. P117]MDT0594400.1 aminodeoxychorismate synthase component I [Aestuariibacter sp. P117]